MLSQSHATQLHSILASIEQAPYPIHSRIHPLRAFPSPNCYVKRDDELGFGISGSKIRKYRTLMPHLIRKKITEVVVIGSAYSNNVLGITQLLIENGIRPILFLKQNSELMPQGNHLFIRLLVEENCLKWIPSHDWPNVDAMAMEYTSQHPQLSIFILKEGASVAEAFPGALTLATDILKNEKESGLQFDHLFIDSGTGMMASAVILAFHWMQKETKIHVLLLAEQEDFFLKQLLFFQKIFEKLVQTPCKFPNNFDLYHPSQTRAFGSTNPTLFEGIKHFARKEGFFLDPVYTAKLFLEAQRIIHNKNIVGNVLIHHSGGALTLAGFQEQLQKIIQT